MNMPPRVPVKTSKPAPTTPPTQVVRTPVHVASPLAARRLFEEQTSLASALSQDVPQARSDEFSSSAEAILRSGALEGSAQSKAEVAKKTKARRIASYMKLDSTSLAQTKGWRIRAAYRMVSYMARITEELKGPMTLSQLLINTYRPDPSYHPFKPATMRGGEVFGMRVVENTINRMERINELYSLDENIPSFGANMTYLPPPVPDSGWPGHTSRTIPMLRRNCIEPVQYSTDTDQLLGLWLDAYEHISTQLRISDGSETEPEAGVFGTVGMFNHRTARLLWPTRDELLIYEMELLLHIFDMLCRGTPETGCSAQAVEKHVMKTLGYSRPEAVMLVKTALRYGTQVYQEDFDMNKIKELKSLEVLADTASIGDDPRAAIAARKQIQMVSGLTKHDSGGFLEEFRDIGAKALEEEIDDAIDI